MTRMPKLLSFALFIAISLNNVLLAEDDVTVKYSKIIANIDEFSTYDEYATKDGLIRFNDLSEIAKVALVLRNIEDVQDNLYDEYMKEFLLAIGRLKDGSTLPEVDAFITAGRLLDLSKQLAIIHVSAIEKFSNNLSDNYRKQLKVYKSKIVNVYRMKGLLKKGNKDEQ